MATYYVATGVTGGDGSSGSPWNWDEMVAQTFANGDEIIVRTGTHTATAGFISSATDLTLRGDDAAARPVINFGAFAGICVDFNGARSVISRIEFNDASSSKTVDFDIAFSCVAHDVKGRLLDVRGSRSGKFISCEASFQINSSNGGILRSYSPFLVDDSNWATVVSQSVSGQIGQSNAGDDSAVSNCIVSGGGGYQVRYNGVITNSIIINCTTGITSTSGRVFADGCLFFGNSTKSSGTLIEHDSVDMAADPFVDSANLDFTLTTAAKASAHANQLKSIMAGLVGVPGITTDSLADLVGGGGGGPAAFNPYQSAFYRG